MIDPHHAWNKGKPLRTKRQPCGCHITTKIFHLCMEGKGYKKAVDASYNLWCINKDAQVDTTIKNAVYANFQMALRHYRKHLETGKTWVIGL